MLELLSCPLLVAVCHLSIIDLINIREPVYNKSPKQHRIGHFVALNRQRCQIGQCLQLGDLDEAVDVVVLEEQGAETLESLQFGDVRWAYDVIETDVLE